MIKFELLAEVLHIVERIYLDETRKHLIEISEHVKTAAGEIVDASMLVLEIVKNITEGNTSRDILTSEVMSMLPEHLKESK